jgi:sugar phosphate isomerase/epimerase
MSMSMGNYLKISKPTFIHIIIARGMGFVPQGNEVTLDDLRAFYSSKGMPFVIGDMEFDEFVMFAKETGYQAVDCMDFHLEISGSQARKILEKHGMVLSSLNVIADFANANNDEKFNRALGSVKAGIDKASAAGCKTVLVMPTSLATPGISKEEAFDNIVKGLAACLAYAGSKGITLTTEPLQSIAGPYCSYGEMIRVLEALPGLSYTHDTGNSLPALENPVVGYEKLKSRIIGLHLKDFIYGDEGRGDLCANGKKLLQAPYGEGVVDFKALFKRLVADKFAGYISFEGTGHTHDGKADAVEAIALFKRIETEATR